MGAGVQELKDGSFYTLSISQSEDRVKKEEKG
jgi:hypothetical protein